MRSISIVMGWTIMALTLGPAPVTVLARRPSSGSTAVYPGVPAVGTGLRRQLHRSP